VADGAVTLFDGDLDDYRQWVLAGRVREASATAADGAPSAPDRKTQKRAEAAARQRLSELRKPLQQRIERIEQRMDLLSTEKSGLDDWLASSEAYIEDNKERLIASLARRGDLDWQLARDEAEWLELHEAIERASG
jgi:ATP-binding cassette subfamily F protein 3